MFYGRTHYKKEDFLYLILHIGIVVVVANSVLINIHLSNIMHFGEVKLSVQNQEAIANDYSMMQFNTF